MIRAARLLISFARSAPAFREEEIRIPSATGARAATMLRPRRERGAPAWIVLQGLTVYGRRHPSLLRFTRALCGSGAVVLIPEIPEWTALRMRTGAVTDAVTSAAEYLERHHPGSEGRVGLTGFSFGATQGLVAAAAEANRDRIAMVMGFGGYCELHRFARFMMTGEHEWQGTSYHRDPDPYARWIVAANYLDAVPGMERMRRVQEYALRLAEESGRAGLGRPDSMLDPHIADLGSRLTAPEREVWDLLAPPSGTRHPDPAAARELGARLADAALAADPLLDPRAAFPHLRARLVLAHGSTDRVIPFTETLRLAESLPPHVRADAAVTRLFAHSLGTGGLAPLDYAVEGWRLLRALDAALRR